MDLGLAKPIDDDPGLTAEGRWLGSVDWAAPEQIRGEPATPHSDVYALGCVLHAALTGTPPFRRDDDRTTMRAHLDDPPPTSDPVIARALAKDPAERFASAGELGRAARAGLA
jgi:serine/threonine-protein kinase